MSGSPGSAGEPSGISTFYPKPSVPDGMRVGPRRRIEHRRRACSKGNGVCENSGVLAGLQTLSGDDVNVASEE